MKNLAKIVGLLSCLLLAACDSQDISQSSQVVSSTQKAYKAYEVRSLVIDEIMKAHGLKIKLKDHWQVNGDFKGVKIHGLDQTQKVNKNSGVITIDLSGLSEAFQAGDVITLNPEISDGYFDWQCRSNVTTNMVPGSCQE